jgi:hypothetical protein
MTRPRFEKPNAAFHGAHSQAVQWQVNNMILSLQHQAKFSEEHAVKQLGPPPDVGSSAKVAEYAQLSGVVSSRDAPLLDSKAASGDATNEPEAQAATNGGGAESKTSVSTVDIEVSPVAPGAQEEKPASTPTTANEGLAMLFPTFAERMKTCFDRSTVTAQTTDQLHRDLQVFQARAAHVERELQRTKLAYTHHLHRHVIAQAELEDAQEAKRFLSSQLMQILENSEVRAHGCRRSDPCRPTLIASRPARVAHADAQVR